MRIERSMHEPAPAGASRSFRPYVPATVRSGDQVVQRLGALGAVLVLPLARAAAVVFKHQAWRSYGFLTAGDFARERLRHDPRWLHDLERLHRTLERLPDLAPALCGADGGRPLGQVATLQVGRVATAGDVGEWIERARAVSLVELRAAVMTALASSKTAALHPAEPAGAKALSDVCSDEEPRVVVWQRLPPDVKWMYESELDLYRNLEGGETSPARFVAALVGESMSACCVPPEDFVPRLSKRRERRFKKRHGGSEPHADDSCSRASGSGGRADPEPGQAAVLVLHTPAMRRALQRLESFERLRLRLLRLEGKLAQQASKASSRTRVRDLKRLLRILESLVQLEDGLGIDIGDLLLEMHEHDAWSALGFAGLEAYAEERLGVGGSTAWRRVALARELRRWWLVREAYERGEMGLLEAQSIARRLRGSKGDAALQRKWIAHARSQKVKRLRDEERWSESERLLCWIEIAEAMTPGLRSDGEKGERADTSHRSPTSGEEGSRAAEPVAGRGEDRSRERPEDTSHRSPTAGKGAAGSPGGSALGRAARIAAALSRLHEPLDDATWRASLRRVPGEMRARVLRLGHGLLERVVRRGPLLEVPLCLELPESDAKDLLGCMETARRALGNLEDPSSPADESRLTPSARIARTFAQRGERVPEWVGLLAMLEEWVWVQDDPRSMPRRPGADTLARDGYRCQAPGCTARARLQVHHLRYRSHQGGDEESNLLSLCDFHHMEGEHGGLAHCWGRAPLDVYWRLGCEELATWYRNETQLEPADLAGVDKSNPEGLDIDELESMNEFRPEGGTPESGDG